jgi:hypothetical protein
MTEAARPMTQPIARPAIRPVTRAFIGGCILGLLVGIGIGLLAAVSLKSQSPAWTDASAQWIKLPEQTVLGALPQTVTVPASSYDFGGAAQPLAPTVTGTPSVVRVDLKATNGRMGVSLGRPDGGEMVSREAVVSPSQGKTTVYLHTNPAAGPIVLLLRAVDNNGMGATAVVTKVQAAPDTSLSQGQMDRVRSAGLY